MKQVNNKTKLIGYRLRQLRIKKGYTQNKIADVLGISPQHYGTLERGVNILSLENILKLCDFYNVSITSVLGGIRNSDRKEKKECEKLVSQIEELGDEHKEVISHMVRLYRQMEKRDEKSH